MIIEDAAQATGLTYKGRPCGSFGNISTFSFYPNKHITTGEGGMILCDDPLLAKRSRSYRNLCFQESKRFVHEELGWNYRMSNLHAALGMAQLETLPEHLQQKRSNGLYYKELLVGTPGLILPPNDKPYSNNYFWVFGILLGKELDVSAVTAMAKLKERGIGTRPFFWPMHEQPVFQRMNLFNNESYPVAELFGRRGFYIPSGLTLTRQQQQRIVETLVELLRIN
jgi:perosamine synthetase